ncbi:MAG: hypothetical protein WC799_18190 [Desulfobacteraceae bacterium]|jgi:hypothetical protein
MLIRIVPDMFIDEKYECVTTNDVIHEIYRTTRFKSKYPWRDKYKDKIKAIPESKIINGKYLITYKVIQSIIQRGTINTETDKVFDLSRVDQKIAACVASHDYYITTVDKGLKDFIFQQFDKPNMSPLYLLNKWINMGFLVWNENFRTVLEDWDKCKEAPQPLNDIEEFERIAGCKYPGP